MDREQQQQDLKDIAHKLGSVEFIDKLARAIVPVFNFKDAEVGHTFVSVFNDIPVDGTPNDYIAQEFKATRSLMLKVLSACGDMKKALKGELGKKETAPKKTYK